MKTKIYIKKLVYVRGEYCKFMGLETANGQLMEEMRF